MMQIARALSLGLVIVGVSVSSAQARPHQSAPATFDRHGSGYSHDATPQRLAGAKQIRRKHQRRYQYRDKVSRHYARKHHRIERHEAQLLPHPAGCPSRSFCGCGAALDVFGRHVRDLWLARNWFRFPPASPAPGMVAVRRHHVFVIREVRGPGIVLAYDANSGGRRTRLHLRSLAGYSVRNPRGSQYATAG